MMVVKGGTTAAVFRKFVAQHLVPCLRRGDTVVMDNLAAHHARGIRELIEARGAAVLFQPPYSPDLNPIEHAWSKIKGLLGAFGARTIHTLQSAIRRAEKRVTAADAAGWFKHGGILQPHSN